MKNRQFIVFVLIGGFASMVNLLARIVIDRFTSYGVAILLAFPIALLTAFCLNRLLVFQGTGPAWRDQFLRFLGVNLLTLGQVFVVSLFLARIAFPLVGMTFHAETIAHGIGLGSVIFTSYFAHKHFTFRNRPAAKLAMER